MTSLDGIISRSFLAFVFSAGLAAAAPVFDLSQYREFKLGSDLATVAQQAGADPAQAKVIHRRPALIQELAWRPQPLGYSNRTEPAKEVRFGFYNGELFRIVVSYDRYETEGMTTRDFIDAISKTYGEASTPTLPLKEAEGSYGEDEEILARWQDPDCRFDLIRSSYGPSFKLVGILKRLEASAQAAELESKRLDDQEAPQRDAARIAREEEAAKDKVEKARLVNKPNFRP